jgi:hypothetical protein
MILATTTFPSDTGSSSEVPKIFRFKSYQHFEELESISANMAGKHPFGEKIARKDYLFYKKYLTEEELTPGNPASKIIVKKPEIYEAVKEIERDLKKSVRKNELPISTAISDYDKVLEVALTIITADTREFESELEKAESINSKLELFTKRVIINF